MSIKKLIDAGTFASIGIHFFCCGLPLFLILFGSTATLFKIPHNIMSVVLIISGLLLATSIFLEFRYCSCKKSKTKIILLVVFSIIYIAGLVEHFGLFNKTQTTENNTELSCH